MKKQLLTSTLVASVLTAGLTLLPNEALAFSVKGCTTPGVGTQPSFNLNDNVTNTVGCQYVDPATNSTNDQGANGFDINTELAPGFFGFNDWIRNGNYFDNLSSATGSFDLDTIVFDTIANWQAASDVLLVLKDGNNVSTLVGYLYDQTQDGNFSVVANPWLELYGKSKNISHISVYYREGDPVVPTPAAVLPALFGMGMAAVRRKKGEDAEVAQDA
jgi:hypothetical protein